MSITKYEDYSVSMSNALVRAAHCLTLAEKRLVAMAASTLDPIADQPPANAVKITAIDFARVFSISDSEAYRALQDAASTLFERKIKFVDRDTRRITQMRWVGKSVYAKDEGFVELSFWPDVLPMLTGLSDNFTTYYLSRATGFKSAYTWRLYELLNQFQTTGMLRITLPDFQHAMDAPASCCADFGCMQQRVIKPAIAELKAKNSLTINLATTRVGRKVTGLEFTFKRLPTQQEAIATERKAAQRAEEDEQKKIERQVRGVTAKARKAGWSKEAIKAIVTNS